MHEGFECGIGLSNNQDLRDGRHHRDLRGTGDPPHLSPLHAAALERGAAPAPGPLAEGQAGRAPADPRGAVTASEWPRPRWANRTSGRRPSLAVPTVASTPGHVGEVLDSVERFVWSFPEVEVISCERHLVEA